MKAAVVQQFGQPLIIEDRPVPEPGPGQVAIRMEASGLCHTDIHAAQRRLAGHAHSAVHPGHEGVGIVYSVGEGVTSLASAEGRGAVARLRMRHLRALPDRLGDAVPHAAEHRLLDGRQLRGVLPRRAAFAARCRTASTRSTPPH